MLPLNVVIKVSKEERGWDFSSGNIGTNWRVGDNIWFYHNYSGKYNIKPIQGRILQYFSCQELGTRKIMIVLCENSIETYPVMLDSTYDIIANTRKDLRNLAIRCSKELLNVYN